MTDMTAEITVVVSLSADRVRTTDALPIIREEAEDATKDAHATVL